MVPHLLATTHRPDIEPPPGENIFCPQSRHWSDWWLVSLPVTLSISPTVTRLHEAMNTPGYRVKRFWFHSCSHVKNDTKGGNLVDI